MSLPSDILAVVGEAAVIVRGGKVAYANIPAKEILGSSCIGKNLKALFGPDIAGVQSSSFVAGVSLGGKRYTIRVSKLDGETVIFISPQQFPPAILNDPFLCAMRDCLMTIGISAERIRTLAEDAGQTEILCSTAALTRSHYRLTRLATNASLVLSMLSGSPVGSEASVDLTSLCRSIVDAAAFFLPDIHFHSDFGQEIICHADANLIRHLLLNLISNCLVHAPDCANIYVSLTGSVESAVISVSNDGTGIEPGKLHMVFDRFSHAFDMVQMNSGPGLGLTVARCIAEAHGGTLLLESRVDRGTTVRASISRRPHATLRLSAPRTAPVNITREVLTGLSDCLPPECYAERYMD